MTKRSLNFKVFLVLAVALVGCLIAAGTGFYNMINLSHVLTTLAEETSNEVADGARVGRAQWGIWELRFGLAQYIINTDPESRTKIKQDEAKWLKVVGDNMAAYSRSNRSPEEKRLFAEWNEAFKNYVEARPHWFDLMDQGKSAEATDWRAKKTNFYGGAAVKSFLGMLDEQDKTAAKRVVFANELQTRIAWMTGIVAVLSAIIIAISVLFGIVMALRLSRTLARIAADLDAAARQTLVASEQVSSSSQSMAQGASEQAASLEEASSTLEQISSMTKQNADHTIQMEKLIDSTRDSAGKGGDAMERMVDRINAIKESSDKTAKIIKTIDEIAFQTNLLALNAAVEAARAGDAGRGFAVVAEEVRNLSLRSAQAAKDTSALIEESQQRAQQGVAATTDAQSLLKSIHSNVEETSGVVREVSTASKEQSRGVDQITQAVAQMDRVTQSNAANAEENAAASEELSAQAGGLSRIVRDLTALVLGGNGNGHTGRATAHAPAGTISAAARHGQLETSRPFPQLIVDGSLRQN